MAKTRKRNSEQSNTPTNESSSKKVCQHCQKSYSNTSSLNKHIAIKHNNVRWMCSICQKLQSSKDSYLRHMKRAHRKQNTSEIKKNADLKKVYYHDDVAEMTESAKTSFIKRLMAKVERQEKIISELKLKLANRG